MMRVTTNPTGLLTKGLLTKVWAAGTMAAICGLLVAGCVVEQAPPPNGPNRSKSADCRGQQDGCVAQCKSMAPDEASRQPCYNKCLRQQQQCK